MQSKRVIRPSFAVVMVPAVLAVGVSYRAGLVPERAFGVLFVALFAWLGLRYPPGTALKALPLLVPAYLVPLIGRPSEIDPPAVILAVAASVFVAEQISRAQAKTVDALVVADRTAAAFRAVATTSASLIRLEPEGVLDAVVDAVMSLDYDGANLVVIDDATDRFSLIHRRGLSLELGTEWQPLAAGMTATIRASHEPLVVQDYASWEHSIEHYRDRGVRTLVGVPMLAADRLVGVLVASTRSPRAVHPSDVEALQSLSLVAGTALANGERYQTQRTIALEQSKAALTDELTALANRRHADLVLSHIAPGTSLVMIDADRFSDVNERLGHAGGDDVLRSMAAHLATGLRGQDFLARFGGEEFLLVLPAQDLRSAAAVVERLAATWRATAPETTFSAGIAQHTGADPATTLAWADAALYDAKRSGRDRCRTHPETLGRLAG